MAFSITFNIVAEPEAAITNIMAEVKRVGIEVDGDHRRGTFAGFNARGSYAREGNQIEVTILEKPFFVSESLIRRLAAEKAPAWGLAVV